MRFPFLVGCLGLCLMEAPGQANPPAKSAPKQAAKGPVKPTVKNASLTEADKMLKSAVHRLSAKEACQESCLLLTIQSYEVLSNGAYCTRCKDHDEMACELDWPSSDVPPCWALDEMRNCIYAGYGRAFSTPRYKKVFGEKAWYRVDAHYSDANIPKVAHANAAYLQKMVKDGRCENIPQEP